eukprot:908516-Pelagomonas_calceolata.AAC.1
MNQVLPPPPGYIRHIIIRAGARHTILLDNLLAVQSGVTLQPYKTRTSAHNLKPVYLLPYSYMDKH